MNEIFRDITGIAMAIVGVAILAVLVKSGNQTAQVIGAATSGFGSVLGVAMGGSSNPAGSYHSLLCLTILASLIIIQILTPAYR